MEANKALLELLQVPGNDKCADCGQNGTEWASYNIGVFLCELCAQVHRSLGSHISKIKSLKLDKWDQTQVDFMSSHGNEKSKEKYEYNVPMAYKRPKQNDPQVIREQWIRAKYERQEFVAGSKQAYLSGRREGYMWKRGKESQRFQRRRFILDATENTLRYYVKEDAKVAKACLRLDSINITVVPDKIGNPNGMQINFEHQNQVRNLFVYAETPQEMIEWYTAIRTAKLNRLAIAYPSAQIDELVGMITRDFLREGWLHKTGPRASDAFRRRWFTLDNRRLMYFEEPMDAFPKGEVFVGSKDRGFSLEEGIPMNTKDPGFGFTLKTPERHYHFSADSQQERQEWMTVLEHVLSCPLSPQDSKILYRSSSI